MTEDEPGGNIPPERTPFEKFSDLTRRVLSVPKAEIDERERDYKEQRSAGLASGRGKLRKR